MSETGPDRVAEEFARGIYQEVRDHLVKGDAALASATSLSSERMAVIATAHFTAAQAKLAVLDSRGPW